MTDTEIIIHNLEVENMLIKEGFEQLKVKDKQQQARIKELEEVVEQVVILPEDAKPIAGDVILEESIGYRVIHDTPESVAYPYKFKIAIRDGKPVVQVDNIMKGAE